MNLIKYLIVFFGMALPTAALGQVKEDQKAQVEALSQCLALNSTGSDRIILAGWFVSSMAAAPQLKGLAEVKLEKREEVNRGLARIFTRLISIDCKSYARPLLKSGNTPAFSSAFEVFGRLAVQELMGNPETNRVFGEFTKYINESDFANLRN